MRLEAGLVDRKGQEICRKLPKEKGRNGRKDRRRQKKSSMPPTIVQKLLETCRDVFSASGVPSPGDVERIRLVLGMFFFFFSSGFCSDGLV